MEELYTLVTAGLASYREWFMTDAEKLAAMQARVDELEAQVQAGAATAELLRAVLEAVPAFVIRVTPSMQIDFINRVVPGLTVEQVLGSPVDGWIAHEYREIARASILRAIETGAPQRYELRGDGEGIAQRHYVTHVVPTRDRRGAPCALLSAFDVTELREQQKALRDSEESLRLALDATRLGLWTWDVETDHVSWNDHMFRLCGTDKPVTPRDYIGLVHPDDREAVEQGIRRSLESGVFESFEHRLLRPDGAVRWAISFGRMIHDAQGKLLKVIGGSLDLTEQRSTEEQLRHAQKLEAVGQLTAGVAHNFNNMLSVILPTLQHIEGLVPPERRSMVRGALEAGRRAADLVQKMVRFAREPTVSDRGAVAVGELVRHAVSICKRVFDRDIVLEEHYSSPETLVFASASDIEQTLVNLLINARDAVEGVASPWIRVETMRQGPGGEVLIRISDNGVGMSEETQRRVFEPFFTTKEPGRGTGLGLATAYAIVRDHGGSIGCESAPARGATFSVRLPPWGGSSPAPKAAAQVGSSRGARGQKILVVDDEEGIRKALGWVLQEAGYQGLSAASASEALEALARAPDVALVLLDRSMPGGLTAEHIARMRALAPGVAVLLHTGNHPPRDIASQVDGVLLKPASRGALLEAMAARLAARV